MGTGKELKYSFKIPSLLENKLTFEDFPPLETEKWPQKIIIKQCLIYQEVAFHDLELVCG